MLGIKLRTVAGAAAVLSAPATEAFAPTSVVPSTRRERTTLFGLAPDWDNNDFLASLSGGQQEMDEANDKYYRQSENRAQMNAWRAKQGNGGPGAAFFQKMGMKVDDDQLQSEPEEVEERQEGLRQPRPEFLKKMGLRDDRPPPPPTQPERPPHFSQQAPPPQMQPPPQRMDVPPQQMQSPPQQAHPQMQQQAQPQLMQQQAPQPPPQQFYDVNGNPISVLMVQDANGNLVPFATQQQPAQPQQTVPQETQQPDQQLQQLPPQVNPGPNLGGPPIAEPPLPPKTKGTDSPRPEGFNPDAYTMSNTADVYFAQLKRDSKVRKIARMSGDVEASNQVFADSTIKEIGDSWVDNPYTREKNLADARAEVEAMAIMEGLIGEEEEEGTEMPDSGINYRDRLEQMRARRAGGGGCE
ncbi:hypothetical protein ACHAXT_002546 [Thalassiosira profunda]